MSDDKKQLSHEKYKELQQLLKNLGITTKHSRLSDEEKRKANELFPD